MGHSRQAANESTVDLVTTLPASGAFTGQLALDTDDNNLYCWDGSAWQSLKAAGSINSVSGSTVGIVDITATTSGSSVTIAAVINDTSAANHFLLVRLVLAVLLLIAPLMAVTSLLQPPALKAA